MGTALAATGIYFGAGYAEESGNAFFLFLTNLVCVNVAGIVMFLFQGLPPKSWRITCGVLAVWLAILLTLAFMILGRVLLGVGT